MLNPLFLSLFLLHVVAYVPSDKILLNCGSNANATDMNGRNWSADISPQYDISSSRSVRASSQASSVQEVPFMTARIFTSPFTFSFPVTSGPKFVRLYFHSTPYPGFNATTAVFSITAGRYTLLRNFSASLTTLALKYPTIIREFILNVQVNALNLTFSPFPAASSDAYAFVNGIEIISMPADLYAKGPDVPLPLVGMSNQFYLDINNTALELVYRLNVGGKDISSENDTGMFRAWYQDDNYIFGAASGADTSNLSLSIKYTQAVPIYTAPEEVYRTGRSMGVSPTINTKYNLTWLFPVDSLFFYLVRLHFCEIEPEIMRVNQRVFEIFINNQTVDQADIIAWVGGNGVAVIKDYVIMVPEGSGQQQDLWLALHPYTKTQSNYNNALLNGLEIFKLSKNDGNLAGPNPSPHEGEVNNPSQIATSSKPQSNKSRRAYLVISGGVLGGVVMLSLVCFFVFRRSLGVKNSGDNHQGTPWWDLASCFFGSTKSMKVTNSSSLPSKLCCVFSIYEMKVATNNFDEALVIGVGGFGNVYKGHIDGGVTAVAIKRLNPTSQQGAHEFQTEIEMLSKLRHLHLVSLIGYCTDNGEMILVYNYMANGTLRDHLYNTQNPPIPWKQRLEICIGAARGLDYLHMGAKHTIIHRDVKSTNILLDEKWVAKVSDFGLSRMGPTRTSQTHVSTLVRGSVGYMDPEYYLQQQLTEKSDVYSFGVVLFEVLCARPAVSLAVEMEQVNLADWARCCNEKGILEEIVDKKVKGEIALECLKKYGEIAEKCILERGAERPSMGEVVWTLEFVLQLQLEHESGGVYGGVGRKQRDEEVEDEEACLRGSFNAKKVLIMQCGVDVESKKQDEVEHASWSREIST